jgi:hypothetical protein
MINIQSTDPLNRYAREETPPNWRGNEHQWQLHVCTNQLYIVHRTKVYTSGCIAASSGGILLRLSSQPGSD